VAFAGAVVAVGVALRFIAPNGLWLDEALSVNISRLPLSEIPGALVQDGSPPLYYFILHFWMLAFGQGEVAVRALSGVASVAALPFLWMAGQRVAGRPAAWAALLIGASSPWAVYYGTDTRMYSLMALEAIMWFLAIRRAVEKPTRGRLTCVAVLTGALMYTHYWDLYLVAVGALWALWRSLTEARRGTVASGAYPRGALRVLGAMVVGGLVWLPWAPVFVFQALHTGTPWTTPPGPQDLLSVFGYFAGVGPWGELLTFMLYSLVVLAVLARPGPRASSVMLELRPQARSAQVSWLVIGTLSVAVGAGLVSGAAFDSRYIAVVFPLFVVLCALGLTTFASRRVTSAVLVVACLAGLFSAQQWNSQPRTQAVQTAAVLNAQAQPGDMIVYCPDQLGPAVDRLLTVPGVIEVTYPHIDVGPQRIDWVNYAQTIRDTSPEVFAQDVVSRLNPGSTLWLVWRNGYRVFGGSCGDLASWLEMLHPGGETVRSQNTAYYEPENLVRFPS
jgi:hypothetical protein